MIDWISNLFDSLQLALYENVVQPIVFGLGLGNLLEDAFDATGWLLWGLIQIVVLVLGIRLLEKRWPVEPVTDRAAVRTDVLARHVPMARAVGVHLYCHAKEHGVDIQSRMFAPLYGVPEDPATGSANVVLIGLLAHFRPEADLTFSRTIGQGFDMGRPSILEGAATKKAGRVVDTYIGGRCVPMLAGTIEVT